MDSNRFVDFRDVKAAVTIRMVLDHYGSLLDGFHSGAARRPQPRCIVRVRGRRLPCVARRGRLAT